MATSQRGAGQFVGCRMMGEQGNSFPAFPCPDEHGADESAREKLCRDMCRCPACNMAGSRKKRQVAGSEVSVKTLASSPRRIRYRQASFPCRRNSPPQGGVDLFPAGLWRRLRSRAHSDSLVGSRLRRSRCGAIGNSGDAVGDRAVFAASRCPKYGTPKVRQAGSRSAGAHAARGGRAGGGLCPWRPLAR